MLTATRSDPRESATETIPPSTFVHINIEAIILNLALDRSRALQLVLTKVLGKGEKSGLRAPSSDR